MQRLLPLTVSAVPVPKGPRPLAEHISKCVRKGWYWVSITWNGNSVKMVWAARYTLIGLKRACRKVECNAKATHKLLGV